FGTMEGESEVDALRHIYGDELEIFSPSLLRIRMDMDGRVAFFSFSLPESYPDSLPRIRMEAPWLSPDVLISFSRALPGLVSGAGAVPGEPCLYAIVEELRSTVYAWLAAAESH